jgi:hypothetical protein
MIMGIMGTLRVAAVASTGSLGDTFSLTEGRSAVANAAFTSAANFLCRSRRNACASSLGDRQARRLVLGKRGGHRLARVADCAEPHEPSRSHGKELGGGG